MEEVLRSLRRIHYLFLGLCAGLGILAASGGDDLIYTEALGELRALRTVPFDSVRPQLLATARRDSSWWMVPQDTASPMLEKLLLSLLPGGADSFFVAMAFRGSTTGSGMLPRTDDLRFEIAEPRSLSEIYALVADNPAVHNVDLDTSGSEIYFGRKSFWTDCLNGVANSPRERTWLGPGKSYALRPTIAAPVSLSDVVITIQAKSIDGTCFVGSERLQIGNDGRGRLKLLYNNGTAVEIPFRVFERSLAEHSVVRWLMLRPEYRSLFADADSSPSHFIPALRFVWPEVQDLSVDAAWFALNSRRRTAAHQVTVLGLNIDQRSAAVIGPMLLLVLLAYFYVHVQHACRISATQDARDVLYHFPWAPIFPRPVGEVVLVGSYIVLPAVVGGMQIVRTASLGSKTAVTMSGLLYLACVALGVVVTGFARRWLASAREPVLSTGGNSKTRGSKPSALW